MIGQLMNNELHGIWKKVVMVLSWHLPQGTERKLRLVLRVVIFYLLFHRFIFKVGMLVILFDFLVSFEYKVPVCWMENGLR
jgi:hypothetical protein